MAGVDRELSATLTALRNRGCHVSDEWLSECVNFYRSGNNQYSLRDLENFVYEQWLLADLRDFAGIGSFPPNLSALLKATLEGKMACQVEYVTDIGHSSYTQMQKVRKEDVGNLQVDEIGKEFQQAWEPKSNRMLQLSLCDGVQTITAIEYRPIPLLKPDLIPGSKGPIICRRGILMLEERHVIFLGGEVETMVITNAYENVLARKLDLPENPDPYNLNAVANELPAAQQVNPQPPPPPQPPQQHARPHPPPPQTQGNISNRGRQPLHSTVAVAHVEAPKRMVQPTLSWSKQVQQCPQSVDMNSPPLEFWGSDEDFRHIPMENLETNMENDNRASTSLMAQSEKKETKTTNFDAETEMNSDEEAILLQASVVLEEDKPVPNSRSLKFFQGKSVCLSSETNRSSEETATCKRPASEDSLKKPLFAKRRKESSSQEVSSTSDLNYLFDENLLDFEDTPSALNHTIETTKPHVLSPHPFVYLSEILNFKGIAPKTFRVKALVITVIEKLAISDGEWKLSAKISDGSANVDVRFSAKVLDQLIGMSAKTMNELKKDAVAQPAKKEILRKSLERAQGRLINLNSLLDVEFSPDKDRPVVVGLDEISTGTATALQSRRIKI